ncbi:MAG: hypothetical protein DRI26_04905, partial [Chloroflexi bacterium]
TARAVPLPADEMCSMESGQGPSCLTGREATHLGKFADRELHDFTHGVGAKYVEHYVAAKRHLA